MKFWLQLVRFSALAAPQTGDCDLVLEQKYLMHMEMVKVAEGFRDAYIGKV